MSTKIKSKLAYAWQLLTGKDAIYSHTFEARTELYGRATMFSMWLEAVPVKGKEGQFDIIRNVYTKTEHANHATGDFQQERIGGPFTRDRAVLEVQQWENKLLVPYSGWAPKRKSHFKKRLKTEFISNGAGGLYSFNAKVVLNKADVAMGIIEIEDYLRNQPRKKNPGPNGP